MADAKGDGAGTLWRSTVDPKSGRTYYYHKVTKETRWDKPDEMCDPEERAEKIKRREETAAFFRAMEKNITTKIDSGWKVEIERNTQSHLRLSMPGGGGFATLSTDDGEMHQFNPEVDFKAMSPRNLSPTSNPLSFRVRRSTSVSTASRFVRTFSSMDDDMLELFRNSSRDQASSPRAGGIARTSSRDGTGAGAGYKDDGETGRLSSPSFPGYYIGGGAEAKNDANSPRERQRSASIDSKDTTSSRDRESIHRMSYSNRTHSPDLEGRSNNIGEQLPFGRKRRNSTGTLYVSTTMSQQDDEVAIKCVCRVIRAHMLDAARENIAPLKEYDMFKDRDYRARSSSLARNFGEDGTRNSSPTSFSAALPSPGKSVSFSPMADDKYYMSSPIGSPTSMGSGGTPNAADEERKVPSLEVVVGFFRQVSFMWRARAVPLPLNSLTSPPRSPPNPPPHHHNHNPDLQKVPAGKRVHHHGAHLLRAPHQGDPRPAVHPLRQLAAHSVRLPRHVEQGLGRHVHVECRLFADIVSLALCWPIHYLLHLTNLHPPPLHSTPIQSTPHADRLTT